MDNPNLPNAPVNDLDSQTPPQPTSEPQGKKLYHNKSFVGAVIIVALFLVYVIYNVAVTPKQPVPTQEEPIVASEETKPLPTPSIQYVAGQIVAKFKPNYTQAQINQVLSKYNASILKKIDGIDAYVISVPAGQETTIQAELSKEPMTEYSETDNVYFINQAPNDQYYANQWGFKNSGAAVRNTACTASADVKAEEAWAVTKGSGITVGIVDTGIDASHPEFAGKIVASRGFAASTANDGAGHGTHVAGVIAASGNNNTGITGMCPECKLVIAKSLGDDGSGSTTSIAQGITWAADQNVKVINISAGDDQPAMAMKDAIDYAVGKGIVVVASSGNNSNTAANYPGSYPSVLSVSSTDCRDQKSSFATYGTWVKVTAPGTDIFSTLPQRAVSSSGTNYGYMSGTSMSTPLVSGTCRTGLVNLSGNISKCCYNQIMSTSDKITGTGTYWQAGRVNAQNAVGSSTAVTPDPSASGGATLTPGTPITPTIYCLGPCPTPAPTDASGSMPVPGIGGSLPGGGSGGGLLDLIFRLISALLGSLLGGGLPGGGMPGGQPGVPGGIPGGQPGLPGGVPGVTGIDLSPTSNPIVTTPVTTPSVTITPSVTTSPTP